MKNIQAEIIENRKIAADAHAMRIHAPRIAKEAHPGQFVEVRCSDGCDPLLRRPLGVHRIFKDGIGILYEVVGKGTELLSKKKAGDGLDVIGPLGKGFSSGTRESIIVAGGIGVAPLLALAERLAHSPQSSVRRKKKKLHVCIGAKTKKHILCKADFERIGAKVIVATEDGSLGTKGFITTPLKNLLWTMDYGLLTIYACGPMPMLKTVAALAKEHDIPCQVSLEERMACGVGVCRGCPVRVRTDLVGTEYRMVCKDGPVFNAQDIVW